MFNLISARLKASFSKRRMKRSLIKPNNWTESFRLIYLILKKLHNCCDVNSIEIKSKLIDNTNLYGFISKFLHSTNKFSGYLHSSIYYSYSPVINSWYFLAVLFSNKYIHKCVLSWILSLIIRKYEIVRRS